MNAKKILVFFVLGLAVSVSSSVATWFYLSRRQADQMDWAKVLQLTPQQSEQFSVLESNFNQSMKALTLQEAQDKIELCSYLRQGEMNAREMQTQADNMAKNYAQKQQKIAASLIAVTGILDPQQKKKFAEHLMHEVCAACRQKIKTTQCLCGTSECHP